MSMAKLPAFSLIDQEGKLHTSKEYKGQYILLYFYPKDSTPGCTIEAKCFRDRMGEFKKHGVQVIGVSTDDQKSHKKFAEKHSLNFPLLADVDKTLVTALGLWVKKSLFGKKYMGTQRDSFLIGPDGTILKQYIKVNPAKHVDEVMEDIKKIKN